MTLSLSAAHVNPPMVRTTMQLMRPSRAKIPALLRLKNVVIFGKAHHTLSRLSDRNRCSLCHRPDHSRNLSCLQHRQCPAPGSRRNHHGDVVGPLPLSGSGLPAPSWTRHPDLQPSRSWEGLGPSPLLLQKCSLPVSFSRVVLLNILFYPSKGKNCTSKGKFCNYS